YSSPNHSLLEGSPPFFPAGVDRTNLALRKPTYQSSIYPNSFGGPPDRAVDGDCHGVWTHASCTHTHLEKDPWWRVDLGESYKIYAVVVKNRQDCCSHRLFGAEIHLGDSLENNGIFNHLCGIIQDASLGSISTIYCDNNRGRYISIHLPRKEYLTVCEVEVYGADNLALGKPTSQSSDYIYESLGSPDKAVDGDCNGTWRHGSCAHTSLERNPWLLVDLGEPHKIYVVVLKNREDCCGERLYGAEVHLGDSLDDHGRANPLCGIILNTSLGSITTIYCNGQEGRYISIHLPGEGYLTVCEVEAYSAE
ncbi:fucolectin-4-like, partial [Notechis scutatus]|uniref:Fucolectin-4-like n=1 Tax=Notechis scutatus TaxID=8663 RepID=A0A6J1VUG3_9SAUR